MKRIINQVLGPCTKIIDFKLFIITNDFGAIVYNFKTRSFSIVRGDVNSSFGLCSSTISFLRSPQLQYSAVTFVKVRFEKLVNKDPGEGPKSPTFSKTISDEALKPSRPNRPLL
jgi:hypothetical protein